MNEADYMRLAIKEAQKSDEQVGCGVVIVREGEVLSQAFNTERVDHDATAHAEVKAIREAGKKVEDKNLKGATMYCTCEPCVMCMAAAIYAKVEKIVFGLGMKETYGKYMIGVDYHEVVNNEIHKVNVEGGFLYDECRGLIRII